MEDTNNIGRKLDELLGSEDGTRLRENASEPGPAPAMKLYLTYVNDEEMKLLARLREAPDDLRAMALLALYRLLADGGDMRKCASP